MPSLSKTLLLVEGNYIMKEQMITVEEQGLHLVFRVSEEGDVTLLHIGTSQLDMELIPKDKIAGYRMLELQLTGEDRAEYHGRSHRASFPGLRLIYRSHEDSRNAQGRKLVITLYDPVTAITVEQHYQFYGKTIRSWSTVLNLGSEGVALEYISSFA